MKEGAHVNIDEIRGKAIFMADTVGDILNLVERGFLENNSSFLSEALKEEENINASEKLLIKSIMDISRDSGDKKELSVLTQMVGTFERMGDEAAALIERIEIKVAEKLLFSEKGVEEFIETYHAMKRSVNMMSEFLKSRDESLKESVIDNGFNVKGLVEKYRAEHADRLVNGLCTPLGANMYFDMLDFTGNLARHSSNVVKLF